MLNKISIEKPANISSLEFSLISLDIIWKAILKILFTYRHHIHSYKKTVKNLIWHSFIMTRTILIVKVFIFL